MQSARIIKPTKPLEVKQVDTPEPRGTQVLVRVKACGICHSDIHLWEGGYEGKGGEFLKATDRGINYPLTPGHEVAGIVEKLGNDVPNDIINSIGNGTNVLVYPWIGEGLCPACKNGDENLCDKPSSLGIYKDGGYSEFLLVPNYRYLINLDENNNNDEKAGYKKNNFDLDSFSTLPCSALTAYGAIKNSYIGPNDMVAVVGAGGLGLMAIQLAKAIRGPTVIAMDLDDEKLKIAKENGADYIFNSGVEDPVKDIMELTNNLGLDAVIDFVNSSKTAEMDMQILRKRARLVMVGLFGGEVNINLISMPTKAYKLIGSYTGNLTDLNELVSLAKRGTIKPIVSDKFTLDTATDGLSKLKDGNITGRAVINPG
jgi:alcohol dehydrogenase, propanol-preferring